jgi:hypothetical protein
MVQTREAVGFVAVLCGVAALTAVSHHPTTGRRTERERAAVEAAASHFTHQQIADAWIQTKLGNGQALSEIKQSFPLPARSVHEDGPGIVFTFLGHGTMCVDFTSQPDRRTVTARRC